MTKNELNNTFWEDRYKKNETGWDIGYISTPLKTYIDQLNDKSIKILIPGAGNSYEAEYFWNQGFKNIFLLDIAIQPLRNFKKRVPDFPEDQLIHNDFFKFHDTFDLIIEQTFFCAIDPNLRTQYAMKMAEILKVEGKLVGLLFDFELTNEGPPFGGSIEEYTNYFSPLFKIKTFEASYNSILSRTNRELFFIFEKTQ